MSTEQSKHPNSTLVDIGPVFAYVIAFAIAKRVYSDGDTALYIGAGVFAVAITIAVIYSMLKFKKISAMLGLTAVIVIGSAAITIALQNPTVFKMKPTALNLLFGISILASLAMGKNVFRHFMGQSFKLPDSAWRVFAMRWGFFFIFLAGLNEIVWRNTSTDFWTYFKLWGMFPITILFTLANMPLLLKHMPELKDPKNTNKND